MRQVLIIETVLWLQKTLFNSYFHVKTVVYQKQQIVWFRRKGPSEWHQRSPDLTILDLFSWDIRNLKLMKLNQRQLKNLKIASVENAEIFLPDVRKCERKIGIQVFVVFED